ncbi:hypothetical protein [Methanobrevibacter sp. DSM 116169]|uniref:hypothetical protein n=1 Tax=Methanobrevibacter sp. DSM 116169 TaxID=3242727 RepID=UPI0038FC05F3
MKKIIYLLLFTLFLIAPSSIEANENLTEEDNKINSFISSNNIETSYQSGEFLEINLEDENKNKIPNATIELTIENNTHYILTDENGKGNWKVNLNTGNYLAHFNFNGSEKYNKSENTCNIIVTKQETELLSIDTIFNKKGNAIDFNLIDKNGNPLVNQDIHILVNGIEYTRKTNYEGISKLNINLNPGQYPIYAYFKGLKNYQNSSVNILLDILNSNEKLDVDLTGYDLNQFYGDGNYYTICLKDNNGKPLKDYQIAIKINGVTYYRNTDEKGFSKLKINLGPGTYKVESIFEDEHFNKKTVLNTITVNLGHTKLISEDCEFYYGDGNYYKVQLLDQNNNSLENKNIEITINGVKYTKETFNDGFAFLKINLNPGTYIVKSEFIGEYGKVKSSITTTLTVLKQNTSIESNNLTLNRKGEYLEAQLKDGYGKAITNQIINIKVNGIEYSRVTDESGIARLKINLHTNIYDVYYNFKENQFYKSSNYFNILIIKEESYKLDTILTVDNYNITEKGDKLKINLKDSNGINLANQLVKISINGPTYERITDNEGNVYLTINLNEKLYDFTYIYEGSYNFNKIDENGKLNVNHTPNFSYSINIDTVLELNSIILNTTVKAPIARMIYITGEFGEYNFWYNLEQAKSYSNIEDLQKNIMYFIPLKNPNNEVLYFDLNTKITSQGISLIVYDEFIEVKYYGRFDNRLNKFDAVFKCYNYSNLGYENLELYLNNDKKASIEYTSYLNSPKTDEIATNTGGIYIPYHENVETLLETEKLSMERNEKISYNIMNKYFNINNNYWNSELGYDLIQSYLLSNSKVTDEDVDYYLNSAKSNDNIENIVNDCFLSALSTAWMSDKLATELEEEYNITWSKSNFDIILSGINYYGKYLNAMGYQNPNDYTGDIENIRSFRFMHTILYSEIEKFSLELSGQEANCGLSDVITAIISGEPFSITDYDEYQVISLSNSPSQLIYYKNSGSVATSVQQEDLQSSKGAVINFLGYLYPNIVKLNFNSLNSQFKKIYNNVGSSIANIINIRSKINYGIVKGVGELYAASKTLLTKSPNLVAFMFTATEIMCGIRDNAEYEDWRYFGMYPVWKGKTFQFISENKVEYTNIYGQTYESYDQIHVIIPYKGNWAPLGENELDRDNAYIISDAYGRVNITAEDTYKLEAESDKYYIERGHSWITEL